MAFKNIFKKTVSVPVEEKVDPIVEQRRKEKFSSPLIYGDEFDEKVEKLEKAIKSTPTPTATTAPAPAATQARRSPVKPVRPKVDPTYQMSEVISPIYGRKEEPKTTRSKTNNPPKKKPVQKPIEDQVVPIISPIYGTAPATVEEEEVEVAKTPTRRSQKKQVVKEPETVTENLRNITNIIQEEEDQLRLVEKRTGEFQFDFSKMKNEEPSLIDEIDDAMTLDELMSLYEKKFKDEDK